MIFNDHPSEKQSRKVAAVQTFSAVRDVFRRFTGGRIDPTDGSRFAGQKLFTALEAA
jgi:hypothetical protein